jgi:hypothetical protein
VNDLAQFEPFTNPKGLRLSLNDAIQAGIHALD